MKIKNTNLLFNNVIENIFEFSDGELKYMFWRIGEELKSRKHDHCEFLKKISQLK